MNKADTDFIKKAQARLRESISKLEGHPLFVVVEDSDEDAFLLSRTLNQFFMRCYILIARDAEEAVHLLRKVREDGVTAVFLDIRLPKTDGVEALQILREQFPSLSVIVVTGLPEDSQPTLAAISAGAVKVINKPVNLEDLRQIFT